MPELPEVEVTRRGLLSGVLNQSVTRVWASGLPLRTTVSVQKLRTYLLGKEIAAIDRRAKYLLFRFADGTVLTVHLGMTGKLGLLAIGAANHKHDHLILELSSGQELRYNDTRRFGALAIWSAKTAREQEMLLHAHEGIEPLGPDFQPEKIFSLAQGKNTPIKSVLMNGRLIAGIGNIYASEILFAAGVHPLAPAGSLGLAKWEELAEQTIRILNEAIAAGGSTIADFLGANGNPGYFQLQLQAYGRTGKPCPRCGTPIERFLVAGRSTWFCPNCQQLTAAKAVGSKKS